MDYKFFIAGSIGAIAPEILRLYQMRMTENIKFSKFYFVISVLYVLLGGYVASIFPGLKNSCLAMCIGVGLVTTINTMAKIADILNLRIKAAFGKNVVSLSTQRGDHNIDLESNIPTRKSEESYRNGSFWDFTHSL